MVPTFIALAVLTGFYLFYVFIGVQSRKPWPKAIDRLRAMRDGAADVIDARQAWPKYPEPPDCWLQRDPELEDRMLRDPDIAGEIQRRHKQLLTKREYLRSLNDLSPENRVALLEGDWPLDDGTPSV